MRLRENNICNIMIIEKKSVTMIYMQEKRKEGYKPRSGEIYNS